MEATRHMRAGVRESTFVEPTGGRFEAHRAAGRPAPNERSRARVRDGAECAPAISSGYVSALADPGEQYRWKLFLGDQVFLEDSEEPSDSCAPICRQIESYQRLPI